MSVTLVTNLGRIKLEIFCDRIPNASFNFLALAASNYYDNSLFHRNIKGFMVQGGDPSGTGKGGESIWGKPFVDEFHPDLKHDKRGVVSFANKGPDTNGSQFFICFGAQPHLNNQNTIIAQVIDGFDVLDAIERTPVVKKNRPVSDIIIERIIIHANPLAT
jgi:peptidyl-prolyl cis-trans isomerase-like 3